MPRLALTCSAIAIGLFCSLEPARSAGRSPGDGRAVVDRFLARADEPLTAYRAIRHLEAAAHGGRLRADMTVLTTADPDGTFSYTVLEEHGSNLIRGRVFRRALEAERGARTPSAARGGALSDANYVFGAEETTDEGLVAVAIQSRRQDTLLVDGRILLTNEGDLVRLEGLLVKRPSFWTRRVEVVRHWARVNGVRVPVAMESVADVLIAGRSTFAMTYTYESVNNRPTPPATVDSGARVSKGLG